MEVTQKKKAMTEKERFKDKYNQMSQTELQVVAGKAQMISTFGRFHGTSVFDIHERK